MNISMQKKKRKSASCVAVYHSLVAFSFLFKDVTFNLSIGGPWETAFPEGRAGEFTRSFRTQPPRLKKGKSCDGGGGGVQGARAHVGDVEVVRDVRHAAAGEVKKEPKGWQQLHV